MATKKKRGNRTLSIYQWIRKERKVSAGLAASLLVIAAFLVYDSVVMVPEGFVGVAFRGGALQVGTIPPGVSMKTPIIDVIEMVQVTTQTDVVRNISCGTSGGVMVTIENIEVVNMLQRSHVETTVKDYGVGYDKIWISDKIHRTMNLFCSTHTLHEVYIDKFAQLDAMLATSLQEDCDKHNTGINVIAVRVTKPTIPHKIRETFEALEETRQTLLLNEERRKLLEVEKRVAMLEAGREGLEASVKYDQLIEEERKKAEISSINNQILIDKEKSVADAEAYVLETRSKANQSRAESERAATLAKYDQLIMEVRKKAEISSINNQILIDKEKSVADAVAYVLETREKSKQVTAESERKVLLAKYDRLIMEERKRAEISSINKSQQRNRVHRDREPVHGVSVGIDIIESFKAVGTYFKNLVFNVLRPFSSMF